MVAYAVSQHINRPPEAVFPHIQDPLRWGWMGEMTYEPLPGATAGVGARYRTTFVFGGRPITMELERTELHPGRRVAFRTVSDSALRWDGAFSVEAAGEGTLVRNVGNLRLSGVKRLLEPFMRGEVRRSEQAELTRLKALLEDGGGAP